MMKKFFCVLFIALLAMGLSIGALAADAVVSDTEVTVPVLQSDPQKEIGTFDSYTAVIPAGNVDVIYPIEVTAKGTLYLDCTSEVQKSRYIGLYYDQQCLSRVGYGSVDAFQTGTVAVAVPSKGSYYLRIYADKSSNATQYDGSFTFKPYLASAEDRTLQSGKWTVGGTGQETWYQITLTEDGYIGITQTNDKGGYFTIDLYKSDKSTKILEGWITKDIPYYYPLKKGTYYFKPTPNRSGGDTRYKLKYNFYMQSSATFTMKNNTDRQMQGLAQADYYFAFKAEKTGTLNLVSTESGNGYFTLCDSSKKALSARKLLSASSPHASQKSASYAVRQGKTYYIKVDSTTYVKMGLKYKITAVASGTNTTKAKAAALTKNRQAKFNFIASESNTYWYKFTQPGGKKLNVDVSFAGTGNYTVMLYQGSKKINTSIRNNVLYTSGNLSKGTYYLKFTPNDKLSSGTFTIKLKS